ncbi:MAG TPA: translocation/assembly module TamB domain-containing protein [Acidobacteriaceae bacterium]
MNIFSGGPTAPPELQPGPELGPKSGAGRSRRRSAWFYCWATVLGALFLLAVLVVGLIFYASTPHFANVVRQRIITTLEDATGGRVELRKFGWSFTHLAVEAEGLTIHGLEGPGEAPYAHIDRVFLQVKILSLIRPKIALHYLEADHPTFHLIIYPNGSTNQPKPRSAQKSEKSVTDTIFDLQAERAEIRDGLVLINQRAIPFSLTAKDVGVVVTYSPANDRYLGQVLIADLNLQKGSAPALESKLIADIQMARNNAQIKALHFSSGGSTLNASGSVENFADPHWNLVAQGRVDLRELTALSGIDGQLDGITDLDVKGQGTGAGQFLLSGNVRLSNAGYRTSYLVASGVNATLALRMTPDEIALNGINARLREGGTVDAAVRFLHWNTPVLSAQMPQVRSSRGVRQAPARFAASIRARVRAVRLPSVLRMVAIPQYQDLGVDTAANGDVRVDWTGSGEDLTIGAKMDLNAPAAHTPRQVPLSGTVDAMYFERGGKVQINHFEGHTPGTNLQTSGTLAIYPITAPSALNVHLATTNLAEFDRALIALGFGLNGKKGVAAIPVQLHGVAEFTGTLSGSLMDPDIKGHLTATKFVTQYSLPGQFPAAGVSEVGVASNKTNITTASGTPPAISGTEWDRLDASGSYSSSLIAVQQATLTVNGAEIDFHGDVHAHRLSARKAAFDELSPLDVTANIRKASVGDLLALAGQSAPISGIVNLQVHATGSLTDPNGGGDMEILGGELAGEAYHSIAAHMSFAGRHLNLVKLTILQDGGTVVANGTYDITSKTFLANLDGTNFELAHFRHVRTAGFPMTGSLKFDAHASGTLQAPSVLIGVHLTNLTLQGQPAGGVEGVAHTQGDLVYFTAHSTLRTAQLELSGQTVLRGEFPTKAKLVVSGFDIDPVLRSFNVQSVRAHSLIGGTVDISGPAREPKQLSGDAEVTQFALTLEGVDLTGQGPLRASLRNGVLHVTQAHITGPDTDIAITGTAGIIGERNLNVTARGSVNMKLAQTFDSDITSSGHVDFDVSAAGTLRRPSLTGQVQLTKVNVALNDFPNGLSNLNGTLVFNQDRLEVKNLVATTGGGQLKVAGFITYQQGIYGDLTATGKDVRVRYSGLSATSDTTMHLQGSQNNMLLSGNILITRFIIGPNLDFAVLAGSSAASAPPNPASASNHVRLDIHIASSPELDFQNSYAQLAGSVDLRIRGTVAQPSVLGSIKVTEGTANFAGTNYQLQHGDIYFTNPVRIDPIIDLDATTRVEEYDVTVGVHGNSSHLTPTFRSEPPLPQADVISLLALGRTQQEQQLYSQQEDQAGSNSATNALLGGALNATVSNRVQRLFGVGSVKIDPTYLGNLGSSTARITVQQNISRTVQITYATNVNATTEQLIQVQVNLTENVSLLGIRDESGVFSTVLKVHKRLR